MFRVLRYTVILYHIQNYLKDVSNRTSELNIVSVHTENLFITQDMQVLKDVDKLYDIILYISIQ